MKHDEIFERLDPPRGGLAALRARMEARPRLLRRTAPLAFAAALAAIVVFAVTRPDSPPDVVASASMHVGGAEVALGLAKMPTDALTLEESSRTTTALAQVPTANPNVSFYWVSSTEWRD